MRLASAQLVEAVVDLVVHKTRFSNHSRYWQRIFRCRNMAGKNIRLYTPNWDSAIPSCTKGAWRIAQSEFLVENGGADCAGGIFQ